MHVCLVDGKDLDPGVQYTTLSYCWGDLHKCTLRQGNMRDLYVSIPWASMPETFRDALWFTHKLGYNFLWIDALCIIQDSSMDWSSEAASMKTVYGNSALNIMADRGTNSDHGLFASRPPKVVRPFIWRRRASSMWLCHVEQVTQEIFAAPLNHRAWVVQERFLAPRSIHFGANQVFWECAEMTAAEALPLTFSLRVAGAQAPKRLSRTAIDALITGKGGLAVYDIWDVFVHIYAFAKLSYTRDRSIAISGLARIICRHLGLAQRDYLAGMWRPRFVQEMLWHVQQVDKWSRSSRSVDGLVPSWSRLSIEAGVISAFYTGDGHPPSMDCVHTVATLLDAVIMTERSEPFGLVIGGHARLRGPLCKVTCLRTFAKEPRGADLPDLDTLTLGDAQLEKAKAFSIYLDNDTEEGVHEVLSQEVYLFMASVGFDPPTGELGQFERTSTYATTGIPKYV